MPCSPGSPTNGQLREGRLCWWGRRGQKSPPCSASLPTAPVGKDSLIPTQTLQSLLQQVWFGKHSLALQPVRVGWCQLSSGTCVLWLLLCCRSTVLLRYASLQVVLGLKRHRSLSEIFHALPLHYFSPVTSKCWPTFRSLLCMHEYMYIATDLSFFFPKL